MKKMTSSIVLVAAVLFTTNLYAGGWNWSCMADNRLGACKVNSLGVDPVNNRLDFSVDVDAGRCSPEDGDCHNTIFRVTSGSMTADELKHVYTLLLTALTTNKWIKFTVSAEGSIYAEKFYITE